MNIEICDTCLGTAEIKYNEDYKGNWEYGPCHKCNGTGRLVTLSYKISVPFDMDKSIIYKADSDIHQIIRNIKKK